MLRIGISASGTSRRSASLDRTIILVSSVVCIACQPIALGSGTHPVLFQYVHV